MAMRLAEQKQADAFVDSEAFTYSQRIRKRIGKATQDLIDVDIGRDPLAAEKNLIVHGGPFIEWVGSEVGIVRRTAQVYMARQARG